MSTSDHTLVDQLGDTLPKIVMSFAKPPEGPTSQGENQGFFLFDAMGCLLLSVKIIIINIITLYKSLCASILFLKSHTFGKVPPDLHIFWVLGRALKFTNLRV